MDADILAQAKEETKKRFKKKIDYTPKSEGSKLKSFIAQECANYTFGMMCHRLKEGDPDCMQGRCCYFCSKETCKKNKNCAYFISYVYPNFGKTNEKSK